MRMNTSRTSDKWLVLATLMPALATTLAFVPGFLTLPGEGQEWQLWLGLGAAPLAALIVNLVMPTVRVWSYTPLTGLPLVLLVPLLFNVDVAIDNSRGYYVGGELDMTRAIGTFFGFIFGFILMVLVGLCAMLGTWLRVRRRR